MKAAQAGEGDAGVGPLNKSQQQREVGRKRELCIFMYPN